MSSLAYIFLLASFISCD